VIGTQNTQERTQRNIHVCRILAKERVRALAEPALAEFGPFGSAPKCCSFRITNKSFREDLSNLSLSFHH
jgi:hypothetical protein